MNHHLKYRFQQHKVQTLTEMAFAKNKTNQYIKSEKDIKELLMDGTKLYQTTANKTLTLTLAQISNARDFDLFSILFE